MLCSWLDNKNNWVHSVTYMSNDSHKEITSFLGNTLTKKVIMKVKDAEMYSLSADTTPDLSRQNHLTAVICYVKEKGPSKWFLALKQVAAKTRVAVEVEIVSVALVFITDLLAG